MTGMSEDRKVREGLGSSQGIRYPIGIPFTKRLEIHGNLTVQS